MYGNKKRGGFGRWLAGLALFFLACRVLGHGSGQEMGHEETPLWAAIKQEAANGFADWLCVQFMPGGADFVGESGADWLVRTQTGSLMPLYGVNPQEQTEVIPEVQRTVEYDELSEDMLQTGAGVQTQEEMLALLEAENQAAAAPAPFVPHNQRVQVNLEELSDYETLVEQFYTIDTSTMAGTEQLNIQSLMGQDMTIDKGGDGPQILIYHTHSQEAFVDSAPGDTEDTIVGVGEHLAEILREEYGYQVLHHTGQYDADSRDDAYGKALPALKEILAANPTIEVVIDLHRDQMPEETKLVVDLDGRPTARFMFFNGLSRTKQSGEIDYLQNDNIEENLAMSFQMQLKCEEYYPGLTRKIYLKGYRYNMHLCPRTLLVELGAQNNTVEEAMNACEPLAHVLDMVLSGE